MKQNAITDTQQYDILQELDKQVKKIEETRKKKCWIS